MVSGKGKSLQFLSVMEVVRWVLIGGSVSQWEGCDVTMVFVLHGVDGEKKGEDIRKEEVLDQTKL